MHQHLPFTLLLCACHFLLLPTTAHAAHSDGCYAYRNVSSIPSPTAPLLSAESCVNRCKTKTTLTQQQNAYAAVEGASCTCFPDATTLSNVLVKLFDNECTGRVQCGEGVLCGNTVLRLVSVYTILEDEEPTPSIGALGDGVSEVPKKWPVEAQHEPPVTPIIVAIILIATVASVVAFVSVYALRRGWVCCGCNRNRKGSRKSSELNGSSTTKRPEEGNERGDDEAAPNCVVQVINPQFSVSFVTDEVVEREGETPRDRTTPATATIVASAEPIPSQNHTTSSTATFGSVDGDNLTNVIAAIAVDLSLRSPSDAVTVPTLVPDQPPPPYGALSSIAFDDLESSGDCDKEKGPVTPRTTSKIFEQNPITLPPSSSTETQSDQGSLTPAELLSRGLINQQLFVELMEKEREEKNAKIYALKSRLQNPYLDTIAKDKYQKMLDELELDL
ncbi:hypothetical protein HK102_002453 [Quaeritorhiza haematococci]|nr:hypothetical protein HK102_002453 [Quaeritorhiza haematococci]